MEDWNGTLSRSDFTTGARAVIEKWGKVSSPAWSWNSPPPHHPLAAEGYLSLEKLCHVVAKPIPTTTLPSEDDDEDNEPDYATLVHCNDPGVLYYDFHVIYSDTYRIPVLYFRGYFSDGQSLQLSQIQESLPQKTTQSLLESKWTFITQEEHPYLNRPWFKLHPCGTGDWMKVFYNGLQRSRVPAERYLISWLSVVGQVVGLRIPLEMAIDANSTESKLDSG